METAILFVAVFVAGALLATAFYVINYLSSRKATADELDERGFIGRKKP